MPPRDALGQPLATNDRVASTTHLLDGTLLLGHVAVVADEIVWFYPDDPKHPVLRHHASPDCVLIHDTRRMTLKLP